MSAKECQSLGIHGNLYYGNFGSRSVEYFHAFKGLSHAFFAAGSFKSQHQRAKISKLRSTMESKTILLGLGCKLTLAFNIIATWYVRPPLRTVSRVCFCPCHHLFRVISMLRKNSEREWTDTMRTEYWSGKLFCPGREDCRGQISK